MNVEEVKNEILPVLKKHDVSKASLFGSVARGDMSNTKGVIALFSSSTHSADTIVYYVEYGAGGQTNESKAVSAGIWTAGDYVSLVAEGHSLEYKGSGDNSSAWFDQAVPTPGADNSLVGKTRGEFVKDVKILLAIFILQCYNIY